MMFFYYCQINLVFVSQKFVEKLSKKWLIYFHFRRIGKHFWKIKLNFKFSEGRGFAFYLKV